jgi:hypothetical protein
MPPPTSSPKPFQQKIAKRNVATPWINRSQGRQYPGNFSKTNPRQKINFPEFNIIRNGDFHRTQEPKLRRPRPWKTENYETNPANAPIKIINTNPPLHFPNASRRLNISDVERKSNPISAPPHRSASNPCKQHYYFGHRIRPRVRLLGRVSEATSGDKQSGWWPFLLYGERNWMRNRQCRRI